MTGSGGLVEVQGTAEGDPFDRAQLDQLLDLASGGIERLVAMQLGALEGGPAYPTDSSWGRRTSTISAR